MSAVTVQEIVEALRNADDWEGLPYFGTLANRIEAHGIAPPDGMVLAREDVVNYIHGIAPLDGVWFGKKHPIHKGDIWWRNQITAPEVKP